MSQRLVPFTKLTDGTVHRVVQGFCCAESVADIAAATGVSQKTCRSIVLALRPRLLKERFDRWRETLLLLRGVMTPEANVPAQAMVFGCLATCYFDRTCYVNHQQGRRQSRLCRTCLIPALEMGEDYTAAALYQIDLIHGFYAVLGIGAERGLGKLTLFRLRLVHTQVVGEAFEATRRNPDDTPRFTHRGLHTVRGLYDQLIRDLESEPLSRQRMQADPRFEPYEDLEFLRS